ncbi:MAG: hypothetical protein HY000_36580 [Planctomycetes bacterium]|nr:hypothetical protein [Planctomycetota bacterium]
MALALEPGPGVVGQGVSTERAYRVTYLAVFPKRHPLAQKTSVKLAELRPYQLIVGHRGTYGRQLFEQALHHEGLSDRARIVAETDTSAFTLVCIREGLGIGIVAGREDGFLLARDLVARRLNPQREKPGSHSCGNGEDT